MISGSLAVEGPPRGLGLPAPNHHLHHPNHHPPTSFVTYHHSAPPPSHHPHSPDAWGVRIMVSQPPPTSNASVAMPQPQQPPPSNKPSEFLRPFPKPPSTRYNGVPTTSLNGLRSTRSKYSPPAANSVPVNLVQHKEDPIPSPMQEEIYQQQTNAAAAFARFYGPSTFPYANIAGPYGPSLYHPSYTSLLSRPAMEPSFLPPQVYSPPNGSTLPSSPSPSTSASIVQTSLANHHSTIPVPSSPGVLKQPQSILKERRNSETNFKVPSGKEGSLKHRILTRPSNESTNIQPIPNNLISGSNLVKKVSIAAAPSTATKTLTNNNTIVPGGFDKGSLIQLANGELRRVEDMRTEDFVLSAEQTPELRLADSTVVRIEENPILGTTKITLSYNQNRAQVEFESSLEHPYFVYGQGWASCAPERTLQCFGLKCDRLQVGDVCVSLMPRDSTSTSSNSRTISGSNCVTSSSNSGTSFHHNPKNTTIVTTATTTAMTTRQISPKVQQNVHQSGPLSLTMTSSYHDKHLQLLRPPVTTHNTAVQQPVRTHSAEEIAAIEASNARKRRWSAPDQFDDDVIPTKFIQHPSRKHKD